MLRLVWILNKSSFFIPVYLNGSVIDIETDHYDKVTCFGVICGSVGTQIIRYSTDTYNDFLIKCYELLQVCKRPFWAYNKKFEEKILDIKVDKELMPVDSGGKWVAKRDCIKVFGLADPFGGVGALCMEAYDKYLSTQNDFYLKQIQTHNKACLLQELMLTLV